jgi:hypothetical protein
VKGATDFDQRWIDETTEAGIAALGWKRPAPRPAEWDKPLARSTMPAAPIAATPAVAADPAPKKKRWRDRLRRLLHRGAGEGG